MKLFQLASIHDFSSAGNINHSLSISNYPMTLSRTTSPTSFCYKEQSFLATGRSSNTSFLVPSTHVPLWDFQESCLDWSGAGCPQTCVTERELQLNELPTCLPWGTSPRERCRSSVMLEGELMAWNRALWLKGDVSVGHSNSQVLKLGPEKNILPWKAGHSGRTLGLNIYFYQ